VEISSDRRYRFAGDPEQLWSALTRVESYRSWWPWLARLDGADFAAGATWRRGARRRADRALRPRLGPRHRGRPVPPRPLIAAAATVGDPNGGMGRLAPA